jgi:hypothetical protein
MMKTITKFEDPFIVNLNLYVIALLNDLKTM